jgi:PleD family two-component response regulator
LNFKTRLLATYNGTIIVLHVDDDSDLLLYAKRFIEEADPIIQIESITSPRVALQILKEKPFDCIVSDYVMPGMNGIELALQIKEVTTIPFILYTGQGSEEVASEAFAAGVDDYFRKEYDPCHYQVLARRIRTLVEKRWIENNLLESKRRYRSFVQDSRDRL